MKKGHEIVHELQQTAAVFGRNSEAVVIFEADGSKGTAYTDGKEIYLPSLPDNIEFSHEETMTLRGLLDHEAGHVRHTNFESVRAFGETQSETAFRLGNVLEDMRLEKLVMEEYPGSQKNFNVMRESINAQELEYTKDNQEVFTTINAEAIGSAIIRAGTLDYAGASNREMHDLLPDRFKAWGQKFADEAKACKNTDEILNLALAIEKLLEKSEQGQKPKPMPDKGNPEPEESGEGLDGDPSEFTFDKDGDFTEGKPKKPGKKVLGESEKEGDSRGDIIKAIKDNLCSKVDQYMAAEKGNKHGSYRVLTTRWDEVYSKTSSNKREDHRQAAMRTTSAAEYEARKAKLGGLVNTMKAKLRRALMAKETRDWDFGREFGKLDTKRLVAGSTGSPSVYKQRKDRYELDTAVHFLIDLSGSMGGRKIEVASESVVAFSECLEGTQIKFQVSGFDNNAQISYTSQEYNKLHEKAHSSGKVYHRTEPLNILKFKDFNQPLQAAKGPIAAISGCSSGNNSDRDAIIWAYHELLKRPEKRKILFVLSDGQPANETINLDTWGRSPLVGALKDAIEECTAHGVECVGVGILTDHVKTIYPKSVSIKDVNDLSGAIFNQLSNLLTGGKVRF